MLYCITGKPGAGKSTLIKEFEKNGYEILIIDDYINEIYQSNEIGYQIIEKIFGSEYVNGKNVIKSKLKDLIMSNNDSFLKLNQEMWPIIKKRIQNIEKSNKIVFIELGIYPLDIAFFNIFNKVIFLDRENNQYNDLIKFYDKIDINYFKVDKNTIYISFKDSIDEFFNKLLMKIRQI